VRIRLSLVIPFLVTCAAGLSSCGGDDAPATGGLDAGGDGGRIDTSGGLDSRAQSPDASTVDLPGMEAWGPETALPVDVATEHPVGADAAVLAMDVAPGRADAVTADAARADAPTPGPEVGPILRVDAGVEAGTDVKPEAGTDVGTKDASAPEATPAPDAPSLEAGAPDAVADAPTADAMVMDGGTPDVVAMCGRINCDCTYKGIPLWGDVEIVTNFPDFKVKISNFPDLNVKETTFPYSCGEWHTVTSFGDFKVQIVDNFEDFGIAYSSFPGMP
jgi:hypothetical protein